MRTALNCVDTDGIERAKNRGPLRHSLDFNYVYAVLYNVFSLLIYLDLNKVPIVLRVVTFTD